jgi:hypothetical protein
MTFDKSTMSRNSFFMNGMEVKGDRCKVLSMDWDMKYMLP